MKKNLNELGQTIKFDLKFTKYDMRAAGWSEFGLLVPLGPLESSIITS